MALGNGFGSAIMKKIKCPRVKLPTMDAPKFLFLVF